MFGLQSVKVVRVFTTEGETLSGVHLCWEKRGSTYDEAVSHSGLQVDLEGSGRAGLAGAVFVVVEQLASSWPLGILRP